MSDFSVDQSQSTLPSICSSNYDVPEASNYNIALITPYDSIWGIVDSCRLFYFRLCSDDYLNVDLIFFYMTDKSAAVSLVLLMR